MESHDGYDIDPVRTANSGEFISDHSMVAADRMGSCVCRLMRTSACPGDDGRAPSRAKQQSQANLRLLFDRCLLPEGVVA
jgi:hypothetical protein